MASDSVALGDLFRRCYGDTYGSLEFYDADELARRIESGSLRSVVAVDASDGVFGHTGINVRNGSALVCETGNTVVDPAARGQGLLKRLGSGLTELVRLEGFAGYIHFPTTAHPIMQRVSVSNGGVETGVMLSYVSADTRYEAIDDTRVTDAERLAATIAFQPQADVPARLVRLPTRYHRLIEGLYNAAGLVRENAPIERIRTNNQGARMPEYSERRDVLYGAVGSADREHFNQWLAQLQSSLTRYVPAVCHVDLPLDSPLIDEQVAQLNSLGFFFAGLLPEFAHTDVLRLQRLNKVDQRSVEPELVNPEARLLLQQIVTDASDVLAGQTIH
ncbi:MAG: GNAT family N-acetyltransferase [Pseudomonadaceae bacterium]|nr:GNAT family N-acetyltransferase [Pseudomonadaceae bacterium]